MTKIVDYMLRHNLICHYTGEHIEMKETDKRIERLKEFHNSHPEIKTKKEFVCFVPETDYMVDKFFKQMGWS